LIYGERWILKVFRRAEEGPQPETEIVRFLAEKSSFRQVPRLAGTIEYRRAWGQSITLAVLEEYIPNQGDLRRVTLDALVSYYDRLVTGETKRDQIPAPPAVDCDLPSAGVPWPIQELIGPYLEIATLAARRTGELHSALASCPDDPAFAPERFTPFDQRSRYQTVRSQILQTTELLRRRLAELPVNLQSDAQAVIASQEELLRRAHRIMERKIVVDKIRCHGNYNLGQMLYTGKDAVIIDFDGEVTRPVSQRRRKRLALGDVAAMLYSLHHASRVALNTGDIRKEDIPSLLPWASLWFGWIAAAFLHSYRQSVTKPDILPSDQEQWRILLDYTRIRRALRELNTFLKSDQFDGLIISLTALRLIVE
jgi:maltose alpha-D-glucosyltransferase/alpha-amylase